jgi:putative SOS response-associated peptidase YedK
MCGRYTLFTPPADLAERFDATVPGDYEPTYNAAPQQSLPVITDDRPDAIRTLQWGLIPRWADDDSESYINARAETLTERASFREPFEQRRCLVLADGFYEWVDADGRRQPYRFTLPDERPFAMAGLYERWEPPSTQTGLDAFASGDDPDVEPDAVETFTIVTTAPNDLVAEYHHRMSVILPPDAENRWLTADTDEAADLCEPYPAENMTAYPVSTAVNDPTNDSPALVEAVEPSS